MNTRPIIPRETIEDLIQSEWGLLLLGLGIGSWVIYKIFLRKTSTQRHQSLVRLFSNLGFHMVLGIIFYSAYYCLLRTAGANTALDRFTPYFGLLTIIQGAIVFVKVSRIYIFEFLFLSHMEIGVPLLLINLSTLILTAIITLWLASEVFNVRLTPLIATSAVFSLVAGLALQDTLGNLFSGVALQFDKPYAIGDWIEIHSSSEKWIGRVQEISWRATLLHGYGDELITIPNRVMGSAQISNFAAKTKPVVRTQLFRIQHHQNIAKIKLLLTSSISNTPGVMENPPPIVLLMETTESWVAYKLIYFIQEMGNQYLIADRVLTQTLDALGENGIPMAATRIEMVNSIGTKI